MPNQTKIYIDIACNFDNSQLLKYEKEIIENCKNHNTYPILVSSNYKSAVFSYNFCKKYNLLFYLGIHPLYIEEGDFDKIVNFYKSIEEKDIIIGFGEMGLDYYRSDERELQKKIFEEQIKYFIQFNKPFFFHCRNAFIDFFSIVDKYPQIRGVVHSFTGSVDEMNEIFKRKLYISFNGLSLTNTDLLKAVDLNYLLLETDAPYCSIRGEQKKLIKNYIRGIKKSMNEPIKVKMLYEIISEYFNISDLAEKIYKNFTGLFGEKINEKSKLFF